MKNYIKYFTGLVLLLPFVLTACGSSDDDGGVNKGNRPFTIYWEDEVRNYTDFLSAETTDRFQDCDGKTDLPSCGMEFTALVASSNPIIDKALPAVSISILYYRIGEVGDSPFVRNAEFSLAPGAVNLRIGFVDAVYEVREGIANVKIDNGKYIISTDDNGAEAVLVYTDGSDPSEVTDKPQKIKIVAPQGFYTIQ